MWDTEQEAWWSPHHIANSWMDHSTHQRSSEGLLWLTFWGYTYIWCAVGVLHITAFHWCKISNKTHGGPLIILQTAGWSIWCTGDHQRGCFDWYTKVTDMFDIQYCWNPAYHTAFHWSKLLNKKLAGPPIISQTAGWIIQCTEDHQKGCCDWYTDVTHIYDVLLESCRSQTARWFI